MAYLGLASTLYDCDALEESVDVGLKASAWAHGLRIPGFSGMPIEGMLPLGRWREAEAILDGIPPGWEEGSGAHWNAVLGGIIAVRAGRSADAHALLGSARDASGLLTDTAFAGNLGDGMIELALVEGRLDDARSIVDEGLDWLGQADDVRFRARVLRLGVTVEAEIAPMPAHDVTRRGAAAEALGSADWSSSEDGVRIRTTGVPCSTRREATRRSRRPRPRASWIARPGRLGGRGRAVRRPTTTV